VFLIDTILFSPAHGLMQIFREIHNAVEQEMVNDVERVRSRLSDLYRMLEAGQITEAEFEEQEKELLDQLDAIEARAAAEEEAEDREVAPN